MTDYTILRNYWDQPLVVPPGDDFWQREKLVGEYRKNHIKTWFKAENATGYARASKWSENVDSKGGLIDWAACQAAMGMILDKSARSDVITLINESPDPWGDDEGAKGNTVKDRLKRAVEKARETAGASVASSKGSMFHKYMELIVQSKPIRYVDEDMRPLVDKMREAVDGIEFFGTELFLINDELQIAGSTDLVGRMPDGRIVIMDLKTGKRDFKFPMSPEIQLGIYSHSHRYDQESGKVSLIHPDLDPSAGVMIHFPIMTANPEVKFYELDLAEGYQNAMLGSWVKHARRKRELKPFVWEK